MSIVLGHVRRGPGSTPQKAVGRRARRIGLGMFFASISVNAALGVYALLAPDWSDTQGKILATSLCVTGAVLLALACEPAWERSAVPPVPAVGALLAAIGFGMVVLGIWAEPESSTWGRLTGTVLTGAVACVIASLLALARFAPGHRWVIALTFGLLAAGATMLVVSFWLGDDPSETYMRAMGIVLVMFAAFAASVPVLHWIDRGAVAAAESSADLVRFCPYCGGKVAGAIGTGLACARCGREFAVSRSSST